MIVVKVGGSLFSHPRLSAGLRSYVNSFAPEEVLLVPGGGPFADAVRELDRIHGLGEEASHWLAIQAMDVMGGLLRQFLSMSGEEPGSSRLIPRCGLPSPSSIRVLNCLSFVREDESRPGALPHSWSMTSDSIAARAAVVFGAHRLVLLKSVDGAEGTSCADWALHGWVDSHFPRVVAGAPFDVEVINFRRALESFHPAAPHTDTGE